MGTSCSWLLIGVATYWVTGHVVNAVAVLVVACACAITLATPVVVLASVRNAARRSPLAKGGIALEQLAKIDTVVMDKAGTLTSGERAMAPAEPAEARARQVEAEGKTSFFVGNAPALSDSWRSRMPAASR